MQLLKEFEDCHFWKISLELVIPNWRSDSSANPHNPENPEGLVSLVTHKPTVSDNNDTKTHRAVTKSITILSGLNSFHINIFLQNGIFSEGDDLKGCEYWQLLIACLTPPYLPRDNLLEWVQPSSGGNRVPREAVQERDAGLWPDKHQEEIHRINLSACRKEHLDWWQRLLGWQESEKLTKKHSASQVDGYCALLLLVVQVRWHYCTGCIWWPAYTRTTHHTLFHCNAYLQMCGCWEYHRSAVAVAPRYSCVYVADEQTWTAATVLDTRTQKVQNGKSNDWLSGRISAPSTTSGWWKSKEPLSLGRSRIGCYSL